MLKELWHIWINQVQLQSKITASLIQLHPGPSPIHHKQQFTLIFPPMVTYDCVVVQFCPACSVLTSWTFLDCYRKLLENITHTGEDNIQTLYRKSLSYHSILTSNVLEVRPEHRPPCHNEAWTSANLPPCLLNYLFPSKWQVVQNCTGFLNWLIYEVNQPVLKLRLLM